MIICYANFDENHGMPLYMMQQIHSNLLKCNKKFFDLMPLLFVHYSNMILTLQSIGFGICLAGMWIDVLILGENTLEISDIFSKWGFKAIL